MPAIVDNHAPRRTSHRSFRPMPSRSVLDVADKHRMSAVYIVRLMEAATEAGSFDLDWMLARVGLSRRDLLERDAYCTVGHRLRLLHAITTTNSIPGLGLLAGRRIMVPVPWQADGVAQLQVSMYEPDGRPFFGDPRHVLVKVLDRFHRLNLTPVVAIEYEFYFIDRARTTAGQPQPPPLPRTGRREFRTQINAMTDLDEYSAVLARIDTVCRAQGIPSTTALAEYGPGQFEVNLAHRADALRACDEALRFKRVVRSVAREHGWDATFLPKPYRDMAGSGLHVHASVLDASGSNIFECPEPVGFGPAEGLADDGGAQDGVRIESSELRLAISHVDAFGCRLHFAQYEKPKRFRQAASWAL